MGGWENGPPARSRGERREPWVLWNRADRLPQFAILTGDTRCWILSIVPLLMSHKLPALMPSSQAHLWNVRGKKNFKFSSCSLPGGARSLPDLISAFLLRVSPCLAQLKDQMSSSTNNFLRSLSDNCSRVQVTHCSCPKARYQVQLALTLQLLCLRCPAEGRTC